MDHRDFSNFNFYLHFLLTNICQGDLRVSETMFRKSVQWRLNQRVDDLISWRPGDVIRDHYPGGLAGHDDDNCPVWIIPFGKADVKGGVIN